MAHLILSPTVVDFFETVISKGDERINLEGIEVRENSPIVGKTLAELKLRERSGANILVILRASEVLPNPDDQVTLAAGDQLLALGTSSQLSGLEEQVGPVG